jgi:methyl-accepting chemotaxis protein
VADLAAWRNDTLRPALADGSRNLKQLIEMQLKAANMDLDKAGQDYQVAQRNGVILLSGGGLLAILFAWFIIRGAMRRLGADPREAAKVARRIASGDLQFEMEAHRHDEGQPHGRAAPDEGEPVALEARLRRPDQRHRQGAGGH